MTITQQIVHLSAFQFWLFTLLAGASAITALYYAFRHLHLARLLENTPTTLIAHAQQGYVELHGTARSPQGGEISAPLSGLACCWFEYKIEKRGNKRWRTLESERSSTPFMLNDASGRCQISPEGARVTVTEPQVWYGSSRLPTSQTKPGRRRSGWDFLLRDIGLTPRYRYTEMRIQDGEPLYAIGEFKTHDELDHRRQQAHRQRELLREWKRQPQQLKARFDRNRDGQIDPQEWEQARLAAAAQSSIDQRSMEAADEPHRLMMPCGAEHPYLISTLSEFDMVKRFKRWALLLLIGFFISGSTGVWLLGARLAA